MRPAPGARRQVRRCRASIIRPREVAVPVVGLTESLVEKGMFDSDGFGHALV